MKEWEPVPQSWPGPRDQEEAQIEIPLPEEPVPPPKEKPRHEMGEDITPADYNESVDEDDD